MMDYAMVLTLIDYNFHFFQSINQIIQLLTGKITAYEPMKLYLIWGGLHHGSNHDLL